MSFKKVRDIDEKARIIDEFLKNRKVLRGRLLGEKLAKQEFELVVEKVQKPVTVAVEKAQNQSELADAVSNMGGARLPEEDFDPPAGEPSPFSNEEKAILGSLNIDPSDKLSADQAKRKRKQLKLNLACKKRDDTRERAQADLDAFDKYLEVHGIGQTGTSLRPNVMKMSSSSTFGKLVIDPEALAGGRLVAYNGRKKKVMSRKVDDDFVHLLTKRYNPKREYSTKTRETFDRLIDLAGISRSTSKSGKCAPVKYYTSPHELCSRLELLMAAKNAGNNSAKVVNEAVGILDRLLNDRLINAAEYKALHDQVHSPGTA